jgi:outer membrane protein assembly factor BamB
MIMKRCPCRLSTLGLGLVLVAALQAGEVQTSKSGVNWPGFRGPFAQGIGDGYPAPASWDAAASKNILWKTPLPGLAHSSPAIWEDRIFVTTAVGAKENPELKLGLYGDILPVIEDDVHQWKVICLDKKTGKIRWEKTAYQGVPKVKRHPKGTHANSSPATDGTTVAAFFGSEGLYAYDMDGRLKWKKDFGLLDSAFFMVPTAQWGFASSPVIYAGVILVQCDAMNTSFLAALDVETGKELWRTPRGDVPTWSTPTVLVGDKGTQVIVNGFKHIGGYDFKTGRELWKISGGGDLPVPTPVFALGLIFINSAHGRLSPIYAIRPEAVGDISLKDDQTSNAGIAWSVKRGGAYMQTPLVYGDFLYNLQVNGTLTCYRARTGELVYTKQLGKMTGFSASGVAADGKLYFASEEGDIHVVKAGPEFEVLAVNAMKDACMATPAFSEGRIYIRTRGFLVAVGRT